MNYYKVTIPQKEITLGLRHGSITLKNGDIVPESDMVYTFRDYFLPIDQSKVKNKVVEEINNPTVINKKKAGRPKGSVKKTSFNKG